MIYTLTFVLTLVLPFDIATILIFLVSSRFDSHSYYSVLTFFYILDYCCSDENELLIVAFLLLCSSFVIQLAPSGDSLVFSSLDTGWFNSIYLELQNIEIQTAELVTILSRIGFYNDDFSA